MDHFHFFFFLVNDVVIMLIWRILSFKSGSKLTGNPLSLTLHHFYHLLHTHNHYLLIRSTDGTLALNIDNSVLVGVKEISHIGLVKFVV